MKYEPMDQVRKNFRVSWYRCPINREDLQKLTKRNDLQGLLQAVGHLALVAFTGYLIWRFFFNRAWVGFGLALFAHGSILTFFAMAAVHELVHRTVFKTRWLNDFFLRIYSTLGWFNFHWYKISHTYHHLYTLHPRGDREVELPKEPSLKFFYLLQLFTVNITGGFESIGILPTIGGTIKLAFTGKFASSIGVADNWLEAIFTPELEAERKRAVWWARWLLIFHAAVIAVAVVFRLWPLPLILTFGTFIGNGWRYFVGVPMHTGLRDNVPDFRKCVRSITLDPVSSFMYWRMNWHTEHHMYAAVPCYKLRRLHKTVADDMPKPRTLVGAWKEMRAAWKRQQDDPSYQFDTPVPGEKKRKPEEIDPLEESLGDIRPESMD